MKEVEMHKRWTRSNKLKTCLQEISDKGEKPVAILLGRKDEKGVLIIGVMSVRR